MAFGKSWSKEIGPVLWEEKTGRQLAGGEDNWQSERRRGWHVCAGKCALDERCITSIITIMMMILFGYSQPSSFQLNSLLLLHSPVSNRQPITELINWCKFLRPIYCLSCGLRNSPPLKTNFFFEPRESQNPSGSRNKTNFLPPKQLANWFRHTKPWEYWYFPILAI